MKWLWPLLSLTIIGTAQEVPPASNVEEIALLEPAFVTTEPLSAEALTLPSPQVEIPHKSPWIAIGLSYVFPGLGHTYLGDMNTAGTLMGAAGTSLGLVPFTKHRESQLISNLITIQSIWQYGIYATYRDVRGFNGPSGYNYQMPVNSFADLLSAPFSFKVLKKPEVWGGLLGTLTLAVVATRFAYSDTAQMRLSASMEGQINPVMAFPIGIGEEALFRGTLQPFLTENSSSWGGIFLSSLAFGAAHIPNAYTLEPEDRWRYYSFSLPLITGFGAYLGWVAQKNHSLRECVALHSWYDFTLLAAVALANQMAGIHAPSRFALSLPLFF